MFTMDRNTLHIRQEWIRCQVPQVCRAVMIEVDENYRAVDAVVEHAPWVGRADPREPGTTFGRGGGELLPFARERGLRAGEMMALERKDLDFVKPKSAWSGPTGRGR